MMVIVIVLDEIVDEKWTIDMMQEKVGQEIGALRFYRTMLAINHHPTYKHHVKLS